MFDEFERKWKVMMEKDGHETLGFSIHDIRVRCFPHSVNLAANDALVFLGAKAKVL